MEQEIEDFNNTLVNLYLKNLNYLKNHHEKIFEKVEELSTNIEKGSYKEKYSLEYKKEGYFDIFNLEKNEFIYGFNSYLEADKRRDMVNFTKESSLDLLRIDPVSKKFALMGSLGDTLPLVNYLNQEINFDNVTFSKIFKFIFVGVGVGVHIHEIYKKIDSMNTLIIEPNLEIFRLSLFTIDYTIFEKGNKKLFLSISESTLEREATLSLFTNHHAYMNYNIKHHLFWIEYKYILDEIIDFYSHNYAAAFSYSIILEVFSRTLKFMNKNYKFLKKDLVIEKKPLKDKKVLLISAGPSVDNHLKWIYENQDKYIIICVDVILRKLEKNNIIPNIVISIDPSHLCAKYLTTDNKDYLKDSTIIFLSQQEESVIEAVKDVNFYFSQVFYISKSLGYNFSLANVGTFSFAMSLFLGANDLYLIGNDAAFNQETGSRYATDSSHEKTESLDEKNETLEKNIISGYDVIEVKGNLRERIKSNRTLLTFKKDYESYLHNHSQANDFKAYNLSDGAYIEGLIPLNIKDIDTSTLNKKDFNTINILDSITISEFDDVNFEEDIKIINRIINRVTKFKSIKVTSRDNFLEKKLDIMIWILEQKKIMSNVVFGNIFLKYIDLIDIYINFTLNLKQNDLHTTDNLLKLKKHWSDSLINLLKNMKKSLRQE